MSAAAVEECANCTAPLSGPYCSQCGQRHEHAIHSFWHFLREGFEDFTHADSRLWRTLGALAFRPGFLTQEFLHGRRARYLPPVRLYLVLSVVFFLIAGILTSHSRGASKLVEVNPTSGSVTSQRIGTTPASAQQACAEIWQQMPWLAALGPRSEASCVATIANGGRNIDESLLDNVPRAMFLFLPLLGIVMKALYRRPPRHYVEHLLFFVHNQAFLFLMLAVYALLGAILPTMVMTALAVGLWIYVPVYFFVSMSRVYGQGTLATSAKLVALSGAYLVLGGLMLAAITLYAMFAP
jgi:hypothetical protein